MRNFALVVGAGLAVAVVAAPALAQTAAVDTGRGFAIVPEPVVVTQTAPNNNVVGVVETGANPNATLTQTGFYNRIAVVQIDTNNTLKTSQTGPFSHAVIFQVGPNNALSVTLNGDNGTLLPTQTAVSPLTGLTVGQLQTLVRNFNFGPEAAAAVPGVGLSNGQSFAGDILRQLEFGGSRQCVDTEGPKGPRPTPAAANCTLSLFATGGHQWGNRADAFGSTPTTFESSGISVGARYQPVPYFAVGPVANYTRGSAKLDQGLGSIDADTFAAGGFAGFARGPVFANVVAGYGFDGYDLSRPGFPASVGANPSGNSFTVAARGGYLFEFPLAQIGPIAGVTYTRSEVDGYTETGNRLLTQVIPRQTLEATIGSAGIRALAPFDFGILPVRIDAFADATAESDLSGNGLRIVRTQFASFPGINFLTPVKKQTGVYARFAGGLGFDIARNGRANVTAEGTVGNDAGDTLAVRGGVDFRF